MSEQYKPFDKQDRAALLALDSDFEIRDGAAAVSGHIKLTVMRVAHDSGDQFLLTFTMPGGELLDLRIRRVQLLEQLEIEADES
jgi:hypothetical protein